MRRTRTHQSLRIRGVRDTDNGAEITFIAYGIRDSAALYIQGMYSSMSLFYNMNRFFFFLCVVSCIYQIIQMSATKDEMYVPVP